MIRKANNKDINKILEITKEIVVQMHKEDNYQWHDNYPTIEDFNKDVLNNNLYVFEENNVLKGFACISIEDNAYNFLKTSKKEKSVVIHRLGVSKEFQKQGIAKKFFKHAENIALENNIKLIKVDTCIKNPKMNNLISKLGFTKLETYEENNNIFNYYEKEVNNTYDVIVVGGGHAGCEAAHICAILGLKTALITSNIKNIADMPCNPSIGGTAKGIIVREIDALGGIMGVVADKSHFQIKMLNNGKGPAVRSLRAQADKITYPRIMLETLKNTSNLNIIEGMVEDLIVENNTARGVILDDNTIINSNAVILTTGTYLKANILIGSKNTPEGPHGEARSNNLSDNLKKLGLSIQRLKTGTPPRIKANSINFKVMQEEYGANEYYTFSHDLEPLYKINEQQKCFLLYTNEVTHKIINDNLDKSAMYGGHVTGIGPRYCPSIEDKIVRFKDKERHQLFLEPESLYYDEWYLQGFSTSMPESVQESMVHSLKGLEEAVITKYAYAIEYDCLDPLEMKPSLENKIIDNLFTAGQINGTSGYEEAAAQGLIAGINAHHKLNGIDPLVLKRNEAYIGVLIDDLVTKGTAEPYRMLTSRAEFRLILRHDNADLRLRKIGFNHGTIDNERYNKLLEKENNINEVKSILRNNNLQLNSETKNIFINNNIEVPSFSVSLYLLLKRPEITINFISKLIDLNYPKNILEEVEIEVKYEGYIAKAYKEAEKMLKLEEKMIPDNIQYDDILNLASEARQKLEKVRPKSIGQAARISGVNPSDLSILSVYLKKKYNK